MKRLWDYLPLIWNDGDFDYGYTIRIVQFKLKRLREHIIDHDLIMDAQKVASEIAYAEKLLESYVEDEDEESWNELFDHVKKNSRGWWC